MYAKSLLWAKCHLLSSQTIFICYDACGYMLSKGLHLDPNYVNMSTQSYKMGQVLYRPIKGSGTDFGLSCHH
jgi:hypothetical protein